MRTLHVISHTHWDREWYLTFQQFRLRLVHLVDGLLELLEEDPQFKHFMLDGQTIVLDDYLHMRPDKEETIREHVQSGRVLIGPWHVLPDMFLVGPEAHIRNLLQGHRTARRFGPKMMVGYIPDPFGHPAQAPQILRGFGIDAACVWRGLDEEPTEFWWQSPDGSRVLMAYLRDSYSNGASLPADNLPAFAESIAALGDSLAAHSAADDYLIMYGTDHMEPPPNTSEAIAYADRMLQGSHVIHSTLPAYIAALRSSLNDVQLPVVEGELRACRRMHLLPGVLSTRMWIKQRNHASESLLTKWVEPFTSFAEWTNPDTQAPTSSSLIRQAWRLLMENHAHDSICGCSIDQVHDEMKVRFDQVDQIGEELACQSLEALVARVTTGRAAQALGCLSSIIVFNPSAFQRSDAVSVGIELPPDVTALEIMDETGLALPHETLGLGAQERMTTTLTPKDLRSGLRMASGGRIMGLGVRALDIQRERATAYLDVILSAGEPARAVWERGVKEILALLDDPSITAFHVRARTADAVTAVFCAPAVPGLGWRTFYVRASESQKAPATVPSVVRTLLPLAGRIASTRLGQALISRLHSDPASKPPYVIENGIFKVEVEPEGTLAITDKRNGSLYRGMNRFVDGGDCGDEYNYAPPSVDLQPVARLRSVSVHRGAVRQTLTLRLSLHAPMALSPNRQSRSRDVVEIPIESLVTLTDGVARVDVCTEVDNRAKDHRLRVHFPTPFDVDRAYYDGHFEVTCRPIGIPEFDRETWVEDPRPEVPQRAFSQVWEGDGGLTLANRGLPEVEVLRTGRGTEIAVTLLRCVGWLSRDDFATRRGQAGPSLETPAAQMIGKWAFEYSICPHAGQPNAQPRELAYAFETPLRAVCTSSHQGSLPAKGSFLGVHSVSEVEGGGGAEFVVSTVKQADDGNGWVVRGYNAGREPLKVTLMPIRRFTSAARVNLAEQKLADLAVDEVSGSVSLTVTGGEIVTVLFKR
jgi:mannosylglycerate hydrolase